MNHILAVCDAEEAYASKLVEYINLKENFPFQTRYFSTIEKLEEFSKKQNVEVALVSQTFYEEVAGRHMADKLILLKEDSQQMVESQDLVWKYQSCEAIIKKILELLAEEPGSLNYITRKRKMKVIGFYSPIKRSLQTTFALTLGQLLGKREKVLYISLEACCGLGSLMGRSFTKDLSDVLYYLQNGKNDFSLYLNSVTEQINGLAVLPPMRCQMDLISITKKEWLQLFYEIEVCTEYDYLLLDLSDGIQGVFDILRQCDHIYMVTAQDGIALAKMDQYEKMLSQCNYGDLMEKTSKCSFSKIQYLPKQLERLTMSEMAEIAREYLKESLYVK